MSLISKPHTVGYLGCGWSECGTNEEMGKNERQGWQEIGEIFLKKTLKSHFGNGV